MVKDIRGAAWSISTLGLIVAHQLKKLEGQSENYVAFVKRTGMSRGTLYALRNGRSNPRFLTIEKMAKSLGVPLYDLLGIDEEVARKSLARQGVNYDRLMAEAKAAQKGTDRFVKVGLGEPKKKPSVSKARGKTT